METVSTAQTLHNNYIPIEDGQYDEIVPYAGFDWKEPDYTPILMERARRLTMIRTSPDPRRTVAELKEYYRTRPVEFITDWGMTMDPRMAELGLDPVMPFIPFRRQCDFLQWLYDRWRAREDGLGEKSRDMGVSWLCVGFGVWMWLFYKDVVVGFGSRKEEYVDKLGDPKSLFWKARKFIELLPVEFRPEGYLESRDAPSMRIKNPENGATIIGEAGDNIGRGNRCSIYFKDEAAFFERPELVDAALSQTSNCKIDISTPNGVGNPFFKKRFGGKIPVFSFPWQLDPRKDEAWYEKQKQQLDPVILAQEVDMDYAASVENAFIHTDYVLAAQDLRPADVEAVGGWIVGVDAAHEGSDESVIHFRRGRLNLPQITIAKSDGPELAMRVEREINRVLRSTNGVLAGIVLELDGPGVSCYDQLKRGKYADAVFGIHTCQKLKDDRNVNLRAYLWDEAKEYLMDMPVCLPPCAKLRSQLTAMRYTYKHGMLLMMSKREYKLAFGGSPDRADAFVLTFAKIKPRGKYQAQKRSGTANLGYEHRKRNRDTSRRKGVHNLLALPAHMNDNWQNVSQPHSAGRFSSYARHNISGDKGYGR